MRSLSRTWHALEIHVESHLDIYAAHVLNASTCYTCINIFYAVIRLVCEYLYSFQVHSVYMYTYVSD